MERHLFDLLVRYGAPLLFVAQMFGIFGLPIPDEILLTIAGALVRRGTLNGWSTIVSAIAGCMAGITLSYLLGRTIGPRAPQRLPGVRPATSRARAGVVQAIRKMGAGLRLLRSRRSAHHRDRRRLGAAGFSHLRGVRLSGAVLWSTTFVAAGYYAGDRWDRVAVALRGHLIVVMALAAIAAVYVFARRRERT